jgi:hypothetical protein
MEGSSIEREDDIEGGQPIADYSIPSGMPDFVERVVAMRARQAYELGIESVGVTITSPNDPMHRITVWEEGADPSDRRKWRWEGTARELKEFEG